MQRPSGARAHEPILVWCVWGQVPVRPCSPAGPSCWGVVRVPSSLSVFLGNFSSAEFRHSCQGSRTLEEILLLLFCAAMQFFGMNKCMVWTLLLLWDAL